MSFNGTGTFIINSSGQPVVAGSTIASTAFNALTADLATGLSTCIAKDGQTATTARIPFASGISSPLTTDATSTGTGSIITAGGIGAAKALWVGGLANIAGALTVQSTTTTDNLTVTDTAETVNLDVTGNVLGPLFNAVSISTRPSPLGDPDSIATAFDGELSGIALPIKRSITGAATAGEPATGYLYTPEISPIYAYLYNESGHNEETAGNDGRTGIPVSRVHLYHHGQGDIVAYNFTGYCDSTRSGSTSFLANPALCGINGDMSAGIDGIYFNPLEFIFHDEGYDVAAAGGVVNLDRTNETGAKYAYWVGQRIQSIGTKAIDVAFSAIGLAKIGMDFSFLDLATSGTYNRAALTLKADQRIYGNATATDASGLSRFPVSTGTDFITFSGSLSAWNFVVNNSSSFQAYEDHSVVTNGWLAIKDGNNAPSSIAGYAQIYVDIADGDLKVIFGDGTIKTIVVDT